MIFSESYEAYAEDSEMRLRQTTREAKTDTSDTKIPPFPGHEYANGIATFDILN